MTHSYLDEDVSFGRDVDFETPEDQSIQQLKETMDETKESVDSFAKVHFRWTVGIKFIGLVALASLLAVEWYSEIRSEASRLVTELSSLGK
ncbi:unnamed protein product, partial [Symbiodinium pilosum]